MQGNKTYECNNVDQMNLVDPRFAKLLVETLRQFRKKRHHGAYPSFLFSHYKYKSIFNITYHTINPASFQTRTGQIRRNPTSISPKAELFARQRDGAVPISASLVLSRYKKKKHAPFRDMLWKNGNEPPEIRTPDPLIKSQGQMLVGCPYMGIRKLKQGRLRHLYRVFECKEFHIR